MREILKKNAKYIALFTIAAIIPIISRGDLVLSLEAEVILFGLFWIVNNNYLTE